MKTQLKSMQALPPFTLNERITHLKNLSKVIKQRQAEIISTISEDFSHRSEHESLLAEVMVCLDEINYTLKQIKQWVRAKTWHADWKFFPSKCSITPQPKGVVGIMAPWNYPFNLVVGPLIAAIAAGNRVMIKPSEITPKTASLTQTLMAEVFSADEVYVVLGGAEVANEFSGLPLDHILFTGSTQVGKIIMRNASENLTPLTLELGGKSPVLIGDDYNIDKAAKSIVAGKWFNAGQTCLAPDYILIDAARQDELIEHLKKHINKAFPKPDDNPDYSCVVNPRHHQRLTDLLDGIDEQQIYQLGKAGDSRKMAPTLVVNPPTSHPLMQNEIFGPILPIITTENLSESIDFINARDKPLTLYLFSNRRETIKTIKEQTQSGSLSINETLVHFAQKGLPFGGIGHSGMGSYHGYQGFVSMSHMKSVYYQSKINFNDMVRAPITQFKEKFIAMINR
ncbi:coniferyl aldehyde dehydrogenase [Marinicella sp. S1101]|uniref:coniferyl aldehyde dehydrogenase n=1 Tax=Marinicella marina TaxID=2996016 RepID=UPI002260BD65|nr:coniferyl aldehyde dehydrogenase [Marinicella marina]MCX7552876.1 coniferyl aldehyde dehydrogenase [Marinicella marina]MDJ1139815.1 coniferyl aldehyde dehydrogenase [Marinicella marina]